MSSGTGSASESSSRPDRLSQQARFAAQRASAVIASGAGSPEVGWPCCHAPEPPPTVSPWPKLLLLDVMDTLVVDPFFRGFAADLFGMATVQELEMQNEGLKRARGEVVQEHQALKQAIAAMEVEWEA